jgi:hypothetical protein
MILFWKPNPLLGGFPLHLTPDEREERERAAAEVKYQREVKRVQQEEVKYLGGSIPRWLANMGHAYWYKKSEKDISKGNFNPVKFLECQIGEDAYYFKIDTRRIPRGVVISNLRHDDTLETLTAACNSPVRFFQGPSGSWYAVETKYGRGNIPLHVGYAEMLKMMPLDAPPLSFPLGMGENQRPYFGDMDKLINLLIGGTKGGGKSNAANVMLCTMLTRNSPFTLRLFLTDLKGGIEFADYGGIPHLGGDVGYIEKVKSVKEATGPKADPWSKPEGSKGDKKPSTLAFKIATRDYKPKDDEQIMPPLGQGICTEPTEVLPMLAYIEAEMDRRARLLAGKAKKISTYNKRFPDKALSYWLVVIDELATMMEDSRYKKQATLSLSEIARKGRAVGIYLVLATQTPTSAIVPSQVGNNMDSRLAFRTGSGPASGVLLGSGEYDAEKLPAVPGRFIWKWGGDKIQMQAPLIADSTVKSIIAKLRAGEYVDAKAAELAQKAEYLFNFALDNLKGECQTTRLYKHLKPSGFKKAELEKILAQYEINIATMQPEITINDAIYYLAPAIIAKRIGRWLVPAADFGKRHPHPDYDYNFAPRSPLPEFFPNPIPPETPKSADSHGQEHQLYILPLGQTVADLSDQPAAELVLEQDPNQTNEAQAAWAWLDDL